MTQCNNENCDRCHPMPRWQVSTTYVVRRKHEREFKVATPEEALQLYANGTAWPSDYDTCDLEVLEPGEPMVAPVTDEAHLRFYREEECWND